MFDRQDIFVWVNRLSQTVYTRVFVWRPYYLFPSPSPCMAWCWRGWDSNFTPSAHPSPSASPSVSSASCSAFLKHLAWSAHARPCMREGVSTFGKFPVPYMGMTLLSHCSRVSRRCSRVSRHWWFCRHWCTWFWVFVQWVFHSPTDFHHGRTSVLCWLCWFAGWRKIVVFGFWMTYVSMT